MRRVPNSDPLDLEIALPVVRQVELQLNARLGADVGLVDQLVRTERWKHRRRGVSDRENEKTSKTSAWKSRKLIGFDNLVFIINPSLRLEFYPAKASVGSRYGLRADWAASIVTDDCDGVT